MIVFLTFLTLILSLCPLRIDKIGELSPIFFCVSYSLALYGKIAEPITFIPIFLLFSGHYLLSRSITGVKRFLIFFLVTGLSLFFLLHLLPGFHNKELVSKALLSPDAIPYSLWVNFDKPIIAVFFLMFSRFSFYSKKELLKILPSTLIISAAGIFAVMLLSLLGGIVRYDPKLPSFFFTWFIINFFFVSIVEEVFFRGFLQTAIVKMLGKKTRSHILSSCVVSILFTILHIPFVSDPAFLSATFTASLLYGGIYAYTGSIGSSIFCHTLLNTIHILLFTYPVLLKR